MEQYSVSKHVLMVNGFCFHGRLPGKLRLDIVKEVANWVWLGLNLDICNLFLCSIPRCSISNICTSFKILV